jgi:hypothetical protein
MGYTFVGYFVTRFTIKLTISFNPYLRLLIRSFVYALIWGIGIAASGGDPGFGFPVPNVVAIILMISIGFYKGVLNGFIFLGFWWIIISFVMLIRVIIQRRKTVNFHF